MLDTEFGTSYGAYRPAEADTYYWRVAHFLFPFYTMIPTGVLGVQVLVRAWVPDRRRPHDVLELRRPGNALEGQGGPPGVNAAAGSGGAIAARRGRPASPAPTPAAWSTCRRPQGGTASSASPRTPRTTTASTAKRSARTHYTGIPGIHQQDQAITESMGTIYDRSHEHLGTSDAMVIRTRRRLINAAKAIVRDGMLPPGVDDPSIYRVRSGGVILPRSVDWRDATKDLLKAFVEHTSDEVYAPAVR